MGTYRINLHLFRAALLSVSLLLAFQTLAHAEPTDEAEKIQRIRQIVLSRSDSTTGVAHLIQLSNQLQPASAAELYRQLAEEYLQNGQLEKAAEVLTQLVNQYLDQPQAIEGLLTLVRLYSSSEVAHNAKTSLRKTEENSLPVYALYLAQQARQRQSDLTNNPALTFQCAVASRLSGNLSAAKGWLSPLKHSRQSKTWHECARVETWLQGDRKKQPPKLAVRCELATERPQLDGKLEEELWQVAETQAIVDDSTQLKWARDDKFLYIAIRCQKFSGIAYSPNNLPRSYDADLAGQDHIRISLDLDRDYASYYQLSIDHRGQTADRCWQDITWNPKWFVASDSNDHSWTIELAIPWAELTDNTPQPNDAWVLAVERKWGDGQSTSWIGPAEKNPAPASFGLLLFE